MFANERHEQISNLIKRDGSVTVTQLTELFGVSIETVRRDLCFLEECGRLCRVHGGAISNKKMHRHFTLKERLCENVKQKQDICRMAMQFICENDSIFIDSGSTALEFAAVLRDSFEALTVVTNSPDVCSILFDNAGFNIIIPGGSYYREEHSFAGAMAVESLKALHVSKAFVFPSAVSDKGELSIDFEPMYGFWKAALSIADKTYVLADSSKLSQTGLYKVAEAQEYTALITDSGISEATATALREADIKLITEG